MNDSLKKSNLLIVIIGFISIFYATYQTAKGFEMQSGGTVQSFVFAILIGLSLVYLSLGLQKGVNEGKMKKIILFSSFYLFVAFFSFSANFNAFYSSAISDEVVKSISDDFTNKTIDLGIQIKANQDSIPLKVNRLKLTIATQILDKNNEGWGTRTTQLVNDLNNLLGVRLTKVSGSSNVVATSLINQVDEQLKIRNSALNQFTNSYPNKLEFIKNQLKSLVDSGSLRDKKEMIRNLETLYNSVYNEALTKGLIDPTKNEKPQYFQFEQIGQISYSFKHASTHFDKAILPIMQSALLDLILPLLIVLTSFQNKEYLYTNSESIFPKRTK